MGPKNAPPRMARWILLLGLVIGASRPLGAAGEGTQTSDAALEAQIRAEVEASVPLPPPVFNVTDPAVAFGSDPEVREAFQAFLATLTYPHDQFGTFTGPHYRGSRRPDRVTSEIANFLIDYLSRKGTRVPVVTGQQAAQVEAQMLADRQSVIDQLVQQRLEEIRRQRAEEQSQQQQPPTTSQPPTQPPTTSQPTEPPTSSEPVEPPTTSEPSDPPTTSEPSDPPTTGPTEPEEVPDLETQQANEVIQGFDRRAGSPSGITGAQFLEARRRHNASRNVIQTAPFLEIDCSALVTLIENGRLTSNAAVPAEPCG